MDLDADKCEVCKLPFPRVEVTRSHTPEHMILKLNDREFHFHSYCYHKRMLELLLGRNL